MVARKLETNGAEMPPRKRAVNAVALDEAAKTNGTGANGTRGHRRTGSGLMSRRRVKQILTTIPLIRQEKLNVYVFGTGSMAELGLGPEAKNKEVKRPRLNPYLTVDKVGVVDIAVGGAHTLALDSTGRLWSWGGNDMGVLGRDTSGGEVLKEIKENGSDDDSDDDDDGDLNPKESIPGLVDIPESVKVVQAAASDNMSIALTSTGTVWAWGTFRCNEGLLGFSKDVEIQRTPTELTGLSGITRVAAGKDHILALDAHGNVYSWGNGQQFQLGRRVVERTRMLTLMPREFGVHDAVGLGSGEFHSFAILSNGDVLSWGLNQFGQCGVPSHFEDGAVVSRPTVVPGLSGKNIVQIAAGEHHSVALSREGDLYVFGRLDSFEVGIETSDLPAYTAKDANGRARFIPEPTKLTRGNEPDGDSVPLPKFTAIACGSHHSLAIATDGTLWSWGFGETYQVGQGPAGEDMEVPTRIVNTATKDVKMRLVGAGGQFSVAAGLPKPE
ncbi:hypothetical protein CANCADRAFT_126970 [Tortispora caseinolytica NRRL Y-17796]|uniref:RCC1-like domain-containing protein n=1 Tax=Tortispora caseinolytica NRRL Y-17796 TaxID=767744 RepID=A0A1E4TA92_9ASCO|nr:hypothetical protein CANCADRAFT_126970 [Tortispora caseinolytica NRRL Y-17796]